MLVNKDGKQCLYLGIGGQILGLGHQVHGFEVMELTPCVLVADCPLTLTLGMLPVNRLTDYPVLEA